MLLFCPTVVSLINVPFVHILFCRMARSKWSARAVRPKTTKRQKNTSKTAESPTDFADAKVVKSYTGTAVNMTWARMQKGINISIP